jgi:hypothetical protein
VNAEEVAERVIVGCMIGLVIVSLARDSFERPLGAGYSTSLMFTRNPESSIVLFVVQERRSDKTATVWLSFFWIRTGMTETGLIAALGQEEKTVGELAFVNQAGCETLSEFA